MDASAAFARSLNFTASANGKFGADNQKASPTLSWLSVRKVVDRMILSEFRGYASALTAAGGSVGVAARSMS